MSNQESTSTEKSPRIRFDPTVNLGHVLTFVGFILAGIGAWSTLDKRLVVLEENRRTQSLVDQNQEQKFEYMNEAVQRSLSRIEMQVDRLNNRYEPPNNSSGGNHNRQNVP